MRKIIYMISVCSLIMLSVAPSIFADQHIVKKGDTLWGISQEYDLSLEQLVEMNDLKTSIIYPDQKLDLYMTYQIEKGDTLTAISEMYDVSVEDLMRWNNLKTDFILAGDSLKVYVQEDLFIPMVEEATTTASTSSTLEKKESPKETSLEKEANEDKPKEVKEASKEQSSKSEDVPEGRTLSVTATAYTATCEGCTGITFTGINLLEDRNAKVIAVDPDVIPLGTEVYVEGYGYAIAGDIGGAIKGHKIDVHLPTEQEARQWGVQTVDVILLED